MQDILFHTIVSGIIAKEGPDKTRARGNLKSQRLGGTPLTDGINVLGVKKLGWLEKNWKNLTCPKGP